MPSPLALSLATNKAPLQRWYGSSTVMPLWRRAEGEIAFSSMFRLIYHVYNANLFTNTSHSSQWALGE